MQPDRVVFVPLRDVVELNQEREGYRQALEEIAEHLTEGGRIARKALARNAPGATAEGDQGPRQPA